VADYPRMGGRREPAGQLYPLIKYLRIPRDEVQLTDALCAVSERDPVFAHGFAMLVLKAARCGHEQAARRHARAFPDMVGSVKCEGQRPMRRGDQRGLCDLWYSTDEPRQALAVEVKIGATYHGRQREKYLAELRKKEHGRAGLVVVTGRSHPESSATLRKNPRWLGEVRWATLYADGLCDLDFEPKNGVLRQGWRALVTCLLKDGDLGVVPSPEELVAWARHERNSPAETVLEAVSDRVHGTLEQVLVPHGLRPVFDLATKSGHRVWLEGGVRSFLLFRIPARGGRRLELGFERPKKDAAEGAARLYIAFHPHRSQRALTPTTSGERHHGFEIGKHLWYRELPTEGVASLEAFVERSWQRALRDLEKLGAFDPLTPQRPSPG
jgi:hypothetical protein